MNKVTPFLMFNDQLEAAIAFYTATFPDRLLAVAKSQRGSFVKNTDRTNGMLIFRCALNEAWSSA